MNASVLVGVSVVTKGTLGPRQLLYREAFNWIWFAVSQISSIIITVGSKAACGKAWCWREAESFTSVFSDSRKGE